MIRVFPPFVAALLAMMIAASGLLDPLAWRVNDFLFETFDREPDPDIVVVEIDPLSLRNLSTWPWPRSHHARVVDNLAAAGAARIVLDIDFSALSRVEDDQALADALQRSAAPVTLPIFRQQNSAVRDVAQPVIESRPNEIFSGFVDLASANTQPSRDGLVRTLSGAERWHDGAVVPTLAGVMAGEAQASTRPFHIDYGIRPDLIPTITYFNALVGNFDPSIVEGRSVIVAATAIELGDIISVPVHRILPGGYVQVLAAHSIKQGRTLQKTPPWIVMVGALALTAAGYIGFRRMRWLPALLALTASSAALLAAAASTYVLSAHLLSAVPWVASLVLAQGAALVSRIDEQDLRLFLQSLDIRRRQVLLTKVAEHAFDGLVTTDDQGKILTFSESAERIFGFGPDEAAGMRIDDICAVRDQPADLADDGGRTVRAPYETIARHASGRPIPVEVSVSRVPDDQPQFIYVIRDIGERKAAEEREANARIRLADAVDASSSGFAIFSADDELLLANRKLSVLVRPLGVILVPGMTLTDILGVIAEALGKDGTWLRLMKRQWPRGRGIFDMRLTDDRWTSIDRRKMSDGGTAVVVTDTTEARQREAEIADARLAAERANDAKTEFLAVVSHELRTPLNAVIGFSEMMKDQALGPIGNDQYLEFSGQIHEGGERLLEVVELILDYTKIESGTIELQDDQIDVAYLLKKCLRAQEPGADRRSITIVRAFEPDLPIVTADQALVSRAVNNLISNAIKFTQEGGRIAVGVGTTAVGDLEITVRDTGIGMSDADIQKAFEPFRQVDGALGRSYEGTGLGLPLSRAAIDLHGGSLTLQSTVGEGTTATIRLPASRLINPSDAKAA